MLEVTSVNCSDISSTFTSGGGDVGFGGGGGDVAFNGGGGGDVAFDGGGGGDWALAAVGGGAFLVMGSGVAGVVESTGRWVAGVGGASSLLGGGGSIPWPGWGLADTGRDTEMSPACEASGADGAEALRLMTFGGELTPATSGEGSSE